MKKEQVQNREFGQSEVIVAIENLHIEFGMRTMFEDLNFSIKKGEKLALAGPNGAGKTTLIKSILGLSSPDKGTINKKNDIRISYVPQSSDDISLPTEITIDGCIMKASGLSEIQENLKDVYVQLENNPSDVNSLKRLGDLQSEFENQGGYKIEVGVKQILTGMGLGNIDLDRKFNTLSGGEKMKVFVSLALAMEPDLLILDEPTNNIDSSALDWLGDFLSDYGQSVLVVSHDPGFLDRFVGRVVEIVPEHAKTIEYKGNYSTFLQKKEQTDNLRQRELVKLKEKRDEAERVGNKLKAGSQSGVGKGRLVQAVKLDEVIKDLSGDSLGKMKKMNIDFNGEKLGPKLAIIVSGIVVNFKDKQINFSDLDIEIERGQRWSISGESGIGKSVLFDVIVGNIKPADGTIIINEGVSIGYFSQKRDDLNYENNLVEEVRSANDRLGDERARSVLGHFLFSGDDQLKKVNVLSQGERSRLVLAKLVVGNHNLLILDEPTSHLDVAARQRLIEALKDFNGTLMIVSNDEEFLDQIGIRYQLHLPDCNNTSLY